MTEAEFAAFLASFGYDSIAAATVSPFLNLAYLVICALPFCDDAEIDADKFAQAQGFLARAIANNEFNPASVVDVGRFQSERSIGRSAIVRKWQVNADAIANASEPLERLKALPIVYGLLKPYMCPESEDCGSTPTIMCV